MQPIVECVPNFSEGRRQPVIDALVGAIGAADDVAILNVSSDADHNRTVVTFVGAPAAVVAAALRAMAVAKAQINLDEQRGAHPRLGATDVCPLVPVQGITLEGCAALARQLGQRAADELGICVYLYAAAATRPERVRLPDIRRGEYEAWKAAIGNDPARAPDFGPTVAAPWGATVIGARDFMIAYNIFLASSDERIAKRVARAVRESSGGLRSVQAKGFLVDGRAQVSMNLHDYRHTPLARVTEAVRREAARYGVALAEAELIGLIPRDALIDAAGWYLQLPIKPAQIIEQQIEQLPARVPLEAFVAQTAAATPTPGGGAVAALAGALAAALTQMVAGLTVARRHYADVAAEVAALAQQAAGLQGRLLAAIAADSAAFEAVMAIYRDRTLSAEARADRLQPALVRAAEEPLGVARLALTVARLARRCGQIGNVNALTDAAAAAYMAQAAVQVAALNVQVNAAALRDRAQAAAWLRELATLTDEVTQLAAATAAECAARGGYAPDDTP